jgi:hypothetical protein
MKTLAALACLFAGAALAQGLDPWRAIDLDRPGALEALKRDSPAHFAKVERILSEAPHRPYASIGRWIRTEFDAKDADASSLLKTSYPAQARLTFMLDDRQYTKVIRIDAPARAMPAEK